MDAYLLVAIVLALVALGLMFFSIFVGVSAIRDIGGVFGAKIIDCVSKEGLEYSEDNYRVRVRGFSSLTTLSLTIGDAGDASVLIDNLNNFFSITDARFSRLLRSL